VTLEEHIEEGTSAIAIGDLEQAIFHFQKATEIDLKHFEAWHSLGMAYMKSQRYPEAIQAGMKAVELNPNDQFAHVSLSMYYQRNGQIAEAEAEATKAKILSWGGKISPSAPGEKLNL
jgi:Flp pilus assembly protein TadD